MGRFISGMYDLRWGIPARGKSNVDTLEWKVTNDNITVWDLVSLGLSFLGLLELIGEYPAKYKLEMSLT